MAMGASTRLLLRSPHPFNQSHLLSSATHILLVVNTSPLQGQTSLNRHRSTMSSYKIVGHYGSTCVRTVVTVLEELGANYELEEVNLFKGEHKTPTYLAQHQPFGQVPTLYDGTFRLFESRAIARYLADKHKSETLYPSDLKKRAIVEQWLSVNQSNSGPVSDILTEFFFKPAFTGSTGDASKVPEFKKSLDGLFAILEAQLQSHKGKFIVGDDFTLADIVWLANFEYLTTKVKGFETPFENFPKLKQWWQACTARPSWQKAISRGF